jgi:hypothetical protein
MRKSLAKHPLRWRVIALVAAYAIALSSLLASGVAARAAAELVAQSGGILCHSDVAGQAAPASDENNNRICADYCCVGCLTLMAAVSLPQARIIVLRDTVEPSCCAARDDRSRRQSVCQISSVASASP